MDKNIYIQYVLGALILIPAFLEGGRTTAGLLSFFLILVFLLVLSRQKVSMFSLFSTKILWILIIWMFANTIFLSEAKYSSITTFLPFLGGAILFSSGLNVDIKRQAIVILAASALMSLIGIFNFVQSENYSYLRVVSTFYHHNAFAGFLILPIMLAFGLLFLKMESGRLYIALSMLLIMTSFLLTFSRGAYISAAAAMLVFCYFIWRSAGSFNLFIKYIFVIAISIAVSALAAYGIFKAKTIQAERAGDIALAPHQTEQKGETAYVARMAYMKHAFLLFLERPLAGFGLGSFGKESRRIQDDARFYSADPHNLYLRFMAELGIFGALFIIFAALVLTRALCYAFKKNDLIYNAFLSGFIGMLLHNGIDFDFQFPANIFIFFAAALFIESYQKQDSQKSLVWKKVLIGAAVLSSIFIFSQFIGEQFAKKSFAASENDSYQFSKNFERAILFDPLNPFIRAKAAAIFFRYGKSDEALDLFNQAEKFDPHNSENHFIKGFIFEKKNNLENAEKNFLLSIKEAPYKDLDAATALVKLLIREKRVLEAKEIAKEALTRFPLPLFSSSLWNYPDKQKIMLQRDILEEALKNKK